MSGPSGTSKFILSLFTIMKYVWGHHHHHVTIEVATDYNLMEHTGPELIILIVTAGAGC